MDSKQALFREMLIHGDNFNKKLIHDKLFPNISSEKIQLTATVCRDNGINVFFNLDDSLINKEIDIEKNKNELIQLFQLLNELTKYEISIKVLFNLNHYLLNLINIAYDEKKLMDQLKLVNEQEKEKCLKMYLVCDEEKLKVRYIDLDFELKVDLEDKKANLYKILTKLLDAHSYESNKEVKSIMFDCIQVINKMYKENDIEFSKIIDFYFNCDVDIIDICENAMQDLESQIEYDNEIIQSLLSEYIDEEFVVVQATWELEFKKAFKGYKVVDTTEFLDKTIIAQSIKEKTNNFFGIENSKKKEKKIEELCKLLVIDNSFIEEVNEQNKHLFNKMQQELIKELIDTILSI